MHTLPFRQVHLDFHTSPTIPGVGADLDPKDFAKVLVKARVNSITLFAKCHHGHLYYDTNHPARHPTLDRPLLEEQIKALREKGIRTPIYISVQCDEFAANLHPEWIALNPDGTRVGRRPLANDFFSWQILDMSSPYVDYLCEQTIEVLKKFQPLDGLFFDMCWDQPSVSIWAKAGMEKAGLDPLVEKDRNAYSRRVSRSYMERITKLINAHAKNVPVWFNSRPLIKLREEKKYFQHVEIEALPTGGWGYTYFPVHVRYARTLGLPLLGMTGRFHKSWADFGGLRTVPSLLYDCAQALAHGAACSIGDQLHPSGKMDHGVYDVIGDVYRYVEKCEQWCKKTEAVKEIAVLYDEIPSEPRAGQVYEGIYRCLGPLGYQYAFVTPDDAWERYPLVIVPEFLAPNKSTRQRLDRYRKKGGKIIWEMKEGAKSPFTATYLRFVGKACGPLPTTDPVFYEQGKRLKPRPGDEVLAWIIEPYFERTWDHFSSHAQTPPCLKKSPYVAALLRGNEGHFALPVFRALAQHGNLPCRQLAAALLERLLPQPVLKLKAPSYVEAVVNRRPNELIVHLLSFVPQKKTSTLEVVEEAISARDITLSLRVPKAVKDVRVQPSGKKLAFQNKEGRVLIRRDWIEGHEMIVVRL